VVRLSAVEAHEIPVGSLDITLYRDDLRRNPTRPVGHTFLPTPLDDAVALEILFNDLFIL
jgi:pyrimidine operon attenuation protein/uracil phosphoribosyltransferase